MIRNLPNKYDERDVLVEIDVHFRGTYDLFYLVSRLILLDSRLPGKSFDSSPFSSTW